MEDVREEVEKVDTVLGVPQDIRIGDKVFSLYPLPWRHLRMLMKRMAQMLAKIDALDAAVSSIAAGKPGELLQKVMESIDEVFDDILDMVCLLFERNPRPSWESLSVDREYLEDHLTVPLLIQIVQLVIQMNNPKPFFQLGRTLVSGT